MIARTVLVVALLQLVAGCQKQGSGADPDNTGDRVDIAALEQACDEGDATACFKIGLVHEHGIQAAQSFEKAAPYYEKACEGGDAAGCAGLGFLYENGNGVPQDEEKTREYYRRGCEGGDADTGSLGAANCFYIGWLYFKGDGVEQDEGTAAHLFQKSCNAGNPSGCVGLAALVGTQRPI